MNIEWYKCSGDLWCELNRIDYNHKYVKSVSGVYIIWHGSKERVVLRIGYGSISQEIEKNVKDLAIQAFSHLGLFVTYGDVSLLHRKGVCQYLSNTLNPKFNDFDSKSPGTSVNLPWD